MLLTLHDALLMANMAYGDNFGDSKYRGPVEEHGWRLQFRSKTEDFHTGLKDNTQLGYSGLCFTNTIPGKGIIAVIAHQGTAKDQFQNFISDSQIVSEKMPTETQVAASFSEHCQRRIKALNENSPLWVIHVGHSLGGAHARIVSCQEGSFSLTADNPGMLEILDKLGVTPQGMGLFRHLTLLSESNPVNEHGARCGGEAYQLMPDLTRASTAPSNLDAHALSFLIERVPANHEYLPFIPGFRAPDGFRRCNRRFLSISKRADAKMLPFITEIEVEPYSEKGKSGYRMRSELAWTSTGQPEWVTDQRCLVHLACIGQNPGHSMIVVERIKINDETGRPTPEIGYYDLCVNRTEGRSQIAIQAEEYPVHLQSRRYDLKKTASFEIKGDEIALVTSMVSSIKADQKNPHKIQYELLAGGVFFPGGPNIVNCCKWCLQKLAIARIKANSTSVIADIPVKMEHHGVKGDEEDQQKSDNHAGGSHSDSDAPRASQVKSLVRSASKPLQKNEEKRSGGCLIL